jgi:hypothetical protein
MALRVIEHRSLTGDLAVLLTELLLWQRNGGAVDPVFDASTCMPSGGCNIGVDAFCAVVQGSAQPGWAVLVLGWQTSASLETS